mmetsp:Transcript_26738/g.36744  ORF Transcript_26738/g.36744 Transcript_26738/m.36744 type:complete len:249 (-) Transcript_26738:247-993(-)
MTTPSAKCSPAQIAIKCIAEAFVTGDGTSAHDWIPFEIKEEYEQAMGHGGLGKILQEFLVINMNDADAKRFLSRTLGYKRGAHGSGVYYYSRKDNTGKLEEKPSLVYRTREEKSAPYVLIRFRDPDNPSDVTLISNALDQIPTAHRKDFTPRVYLKLVRDKLQGIKGRGNAVPRPTSAKVKKPKKMNPAKRAAPVLNEETNHAARRFKAAGEILLADPVGAQGIIELSNFLTQYVDMSAILKTPNKEL